MQHGFVASAMAETCDPVQKHADALRDAPDHQKAPLLCACGSLCVGLSLKVEKAVKHILVEGVSLVEALHGAGIPFQIFGDRWGSPSSFWAVEARNIDLRSVVLPEGAALNAGGVIPCASMCGEAAQEQDADENADGSAARWKGRMITVEVSHNSWIASLIRRVDPDRQRIELEAPVVVYGMELPRSVRFSVGPWVGHAPLLMQHALQKLRSRSDIRDTVLMNWALRGAADSFHL